MPAIASDWPQVEPMDDAVRSEILLTGGGGQVGSELQRLAPSSWRLVAPGRGELDLGDPDCVTAAVASRRWAAVINAGAYTAVDRAESDQVAAWRINALGPAALAAATALAGIPLIHISTDYVFDGAKSDAYVEDDKVGPLGVYGASKEGGEQAVRTGNPRHIILRTAWVYSAHGANFVKTMLRLGAERPALRVVDDQYGCPTSASDIARAVIAMTERRLSDSLAPTGTYHFVNDGEATWCGFARAIFAAAERRGYKAPQVEAIPTSEFPTAARRPANSRLCTAKLRHDFEIAPQAWSAALEETLDSLFSSLSERNT
jgi:dTDP-4-dehydrorhamnose reductase